MASLFFLVVRLHVLFLANSKRAQSGLCTGRVFYVVDIVQVVGTQRYHRQDVTLWRI